MKALLGMSFCPFSALFSTLSRLKLTLRSPRTKIHFECQCNDDAAAHFASAFRDIIATSRRYVMADASSESVPGQKYPRFNWQLKILSLDTTSDDSGAATALPAVILLGETLYVTQSTQFCGRDKAAECAQTALATLDKP
jgi:hypothetical protein